MKKIKNIFISLVLLASLFSVIAYTNADSNKREDVSKAYEIDKYLVYDDAVTTSNDSLESAWYDINPHSTQVEMYLYVDDTARIDYYIDYRYGADQEVTLAVDSIVTVGTALTGKGKGIVLKGYGTSAIVNNIPGARQVRYRAYWNARSEATIKHHAAIIQN